MDQNELRFIDDAHRKLVDLKRGLLAVSEDPYYAIDRFAEMGIREAPQYILDDVMKVFLESLDAIEEFKDFDVVVSASGLLRVCIKGTREGLAVIDMNTKLYLVGTMTNELPPAGLVDDLEKRRRQLKAVIKDRETVHKDLIQRIKDFITGSSVKDCTEELEALDALDNSTKKDYLKWSCEYDRVKSQIDAINQIIIPMLQQYGYKPGRP